MFKSFQVNSSLGRNSNEIQGHELKAFDFEPFHVSKEHPSTTKLKSDRQKAIVLYKNKNDKTGFAKDHTFSEVSKKEKNKKEKKKDKKKKKTVVKIKDNTTTDDYSADYEKADDTPDTSAQNHGTNSDVAGGGGPIPPNNNFSDSEIPQSTDEWLKILLVEPNYKLLMQFVDYYQSRLIPATTFYEVLTAMTEDSREEMNALAVTAAGSTPSYNSFLFLTSIIAEGQSNKVKGSAKEQLSVYKNLQYLNVLRSIVVDSEQASASLLAANLIALSAKQNLKPKENVTDSSSEQGIPSENTPQTSNLLVENIKRNYELTRELLSAVVLRLQDNHLISAIQEAIQVIDESLKV